MGTSSEPPHVDLDALRATYWMREYDDAYIICTLVDELEGARQKAAFAAAALAAVDTMSPHDDPLAFHQVAIERARAALADARPEEGP